MKANHLGVTLAFLTATVAACSGTSNPGSTVIDGSITDATTDSALGTDTATETPAAVDAGPPGVCKVATDCDWGEIPHEILVKADCVCLFGCGYLPQSKTTIARRKAQYTGLCDPTKDGAGRPCGIDDCATPGPIDCLSGTCGAAKADAAAE